MSQQPSPVREQQLLVRILSGEHLDHDLPQYWPKLLQYSYLRDLGLNQKEAASAVGRCARTVRSWEHDDPDLYLLARMSARLLWQHELDAAARRRLLHLLDVESENPDLLALQLDAIKFHLERTNPEYAPPAKRVEHNDDTRRVDLHGVVELPPMDTGLASEPLKEVSHDLTDAPPSSSISPEMAPNDPEGEKPGRNDSGPPRSVELPGLDRGE